MDKLPRELVDHILRYLVWTGNRNEALQARLVCRMFDRFLKSYACRTVSLNFSRLNKQEIRRRPHLDDLQTIGKHCKALNIDLTPIRDDIEVMMIEDATQETPETAELYPLLRSFATHDGTLTWPEYRSLLDSMLLTCDRIEALQLSLPMTIVNGGPYEDPIRAFANTIAAFASRLNDEGARPLRTLVLENLDDQILQSIWLNPMDIDYAARVMSHLRNLVIVFRVRPQYFEHPETALNFFRHMISAASKLESLCMRGRDSPFEPPQSLILQMDPDWNDLADETDLGGLLMLDIPTNLTRLELNKLEVSPKTFRFIARYLGPTLQELYLSELYIRLQILEEPDRTDRLWVGRPNQRPEESDTWVAILIRDNCPRLKICRAAFLGYEVIPDLEEEPPLLDLPDPSGLARSVAQRFVEVVLGYAQPDAVPDLSPTPSGETPPGRAIQHLPYDPANDARFLGAAALRPRPAGSLRLADYSIYAYQDSVENNTSPWHNAIDTVFPPQLSSDKRALDKIVQLFRIVKLDPGGGETGRQTGPFWQYV